MVVLFFVLLFDVGWLVADVMVAGLAGDAGGTCCVAGGGVVSGATAALFHGSGGRVPELGWGPFENRVLGMMPCGVSGNARFRRAPVSVEVSVWRSLFSGTFQRVPYIGTGEPFRDFWLCPLRPSV